MRPGFISTCLCLWWMAFVDAQQAYDFGIDVEKFTRRQNDGSRIVVGRLPFASNNTIPRRMEIREMREDTYKWDLFMLALSMFQYVNQDDPLSWYQIAGIHGVPFQTWNGVEPVPGGALSGYCTHSSALFPTWHRPYLALFEQEVYRLANLIAGMYQNSAERALYQRAASDLRIPYWDWAKDAPPGQTQFPDVFWDAVITQTGPRGPQLIRNPLYSYQFRPVNEDAFIWAPLKYWPETKRAPDTNVSIMYPPSRNELINTALLGKLPEIQQRLYILFSGYKDFNSFGNKAWAVSQNLSSVDSLEAVHDVIHIYGGLKGHMTYVPLSAFDPIFFMHHAMTDRLVAIWQILNPKSWIQPMEAGETSYNSLKGTIQQSDTPLTPFFKSHDGAFWTSDDARTTEAFGYTYADTDPLLAAHQNFRGELARRITMWYGGSSAVALRPKTAPEPGLEPLGNVLLRDGRFKSFRPNVKPNAPDPSLENIVQQGRYTEWVANVHVNVEALDGSFTIHFFVGEAPTSVGEWEEALNHIGSVNIFAMDRNTGSQSKISGTLPLTSALMKIVAIGAIPNLDPAAVSSFLRGTLQFRVIGSDDSEVDPRRVDGMFIGVSSSEVTMPITDLELPQWGPMVRRLEMWPDEH